MVAFRQTVDLPYTFDAVTCKQISLYAGEDHEPYPGIIANISESEEYYMVFFDDGHVQKIHYNDIRCVIGNDGLENGKF